jgi:hypothetical protein
MRQRGRRRHVAWGSTGRGCARSGRGGQAPARWADGPRGSGPGNGPGRRSVVSTAALMVGGTYPVPVGDIRPSGLAPFSWSGTVMRISRYPARDHAPCHGAVGRDRCNADLFGLSATAARRTPSRSVDRSVPAGQRNVGPSARTPLPGRSGGGAQSSPPAIIPSNGSPSNPCYNVVRPARARGASRRVGAACRRSTVAIGIAHGFHQGGSPWDRWTCWRERFPAGRRWRRSASPSTTRPVGRSATSWPWRPTGSGRAGADCPQDRRRAAGRRRAPRRVRPAPEGCPRGGHGRGRSAVTGPLRRFRSAGIAPRRSITRRPNPLGPRRSRRSYAGSFRAGRPRSAAPKSTAARTR